MKFKFNSLFYRKAYQESNSSNRHVKVIFPIGEKLGLIVGLVILISVSVLTFLTSRLMAESVKGSTMKNIFTLNERTASSVEKQLGAISGNVFEFLDIDAGSSIALNAQSKKSFMELTEELFFKRNENIAAFCIFPKEFAFNQLNIHFNKNYGIEEQSLKEAIEFCANTISECMEKKISLCENVSPCFNKEMLAIFMPWNDGETTQILGIFFNLSDSLNSPDLDSEYLTFFVNGKGRFVSSGDSSKIMEGASYESSELFRMISSTSYQNGGTQVSFTDLNENGKKEKYLGTFKKLDSTDIYVITTVPLSMALEDVHRTTRNNYLLAAVIFFVTVIVVMIYSKYGISNHLYALVDATDEIRKGNFNSEKISELKLNRHDEIGVLNESIKAERKFLNTFAKFTNQNVAKAIACNELDFNPHLKDLTIFFSDIRGFTAISDSFKNQYGQNSSTEIISFLNDYMSRMVNCVTLSHGNIDKFEGDAIMGLWGILRDDDLDYELSMEQHVEKLQEQRGHTLSVEELDELTLYRHQCQVQHKKHVMEDAVNAIMGSVAMRYALMEYNKKAVEINSRGDGSFLPEIKIGCGLNVGRVTAGLMGSSDKMEYTAIGDAVNFASRTESSNKACGTDILITEDVYQLLKLDYIKCRENNYTIPEENTDMEILVEKIPAKFEVKGKGVQHFYGVVNMPKFDVCKFFRKNNPDFISDPDCLKACGENGPQTLSQLRKLLGIKKPDFKKVDLNAEENKIQISK